MIWFWDICIIPATSVMFATTILLLIRFHLQPSNDAQMESTQGSDITDMATSTLAPKHIMYIITIFFCLGSNAMVLIVIRHQTQLQVHMRVLYEIMAASDMIYGIIWNAWQLLWSISTSKEACTNISMAFSYVYQVSHSIAMVSLCGISLNLYILVTRPLRYYTLVTRRRFGFTVTLATLMIALSSGIYLPIPNTTFMNLMIDRCLNKDLSAKSNWASAVHTFYQTFLPCATLVFTSFINIKLLLIVRQKTKAVANFETIIRIDQCHAKAQNVPLGQVRGFLDRRYSRWRMKGYVTVTLMSVSFCTLWSPHVIYYVIKVDQSVVAILDKISISSTWILPVLYMLTNAEARRLFWKWLRCNR